MTRHRTPRWLAVAAAATIGLVASACSDDDAPPTDDRIPADDAGTGDDEGEEVDAATQRQANAEPADLDGPITTGTLSPPLDPRGVDLDAHGYVEEEYFATGTATAYAAVGELGEDGLWEVEPASTAPYRTRFVVRRPADPDRFSGTVVVEWLNVTVAEASPSWTYTHRAMLEAGAAWVGLSAQALGVVGGTPVISLGADQEQVPTGGIRDTNPERYGSLEHPGDQYGFDILSQVGAALRSPGGAAVLGDATANRIIAAGESQSAGFLSGYINAVQPVADVFDGFFVHSRGAGVALPDGTRNVRGEVAAYRLRTDLDAPVMVFQTETDVGPLLRFALARQPDTDTLRTWEAAGTAHADAYLVGAEFPLCPDGINTGPHHYVATAAMAALLGWVEDGIEPPRAEPIRTGGDDGVAILRDEDGIALGGVRTPSVDVPVARLSGEAPPDTELLCALFGSAEPFTGEELRSRYTSQQEYLDAFDESLDDAVSLGFIRSADRDDYAAEARQVDL